MKKLNSYLIFILATPLLAIPSLASEGWMFEKVENIFNPSHGNGGETVHIPSFLVTEEDTVIAVCQLRRKSRWDFGNEVDLLISRSLDGGRTWETPKTLYSEPGINAVNGPILEDRETGDIILTFTAVPVGDETQADWVTSMVRSGGQIKTIRSRDQGKTWTAIETTKPISERNQIAWPSNGSHGIQLSSGRLVVGAFVAKTEAEQKSYLECEYAAGMMYSDDHGETWKIGATVPYNGTDENVCVETVNGEIYYNFRLNNRTPKDLVRGYAYSRDGGESFYEVGLQDNMSRVNCHVGLARFSTIHKGGRNILLYSGPFGYTGAEMEGPNDRSRLTVRASFDEGRTWPIAQEIEKGYGGYSDLVVTKDGTILCIYGVHTFNPEKSRMDVIRLSWDAMENVYRAHVEKLN